MNHFEEEFESKFPTIRKRTKAFLYRLEPKMRCIGTKGTMPIFIMVRKALFDVAGWLPAQVTDDKGFIRKYAVNIGIEQKSTKQRHPSLRIVGADMDGSGVQAHQLEALAAVHRDGGIARILWNNGGIIGCMDGEEITKVFYDYGVSVAAEKMRKQPARGSRSIPWSMFRTINWLEHPESVILAPVKEPTLKQALDAKRRKNAKQIEEAERAKAEREDVETSGANIVDFDLGEQDDADLPF